MEGYGGGEWSFHGVCGLLVGEGRLYLEGEEDSSVEGTEGPFCRLWFGHLALPVWAVYLAPWSALVVKRLLEHVGAEGR